MLDGIPSIETISAVPPRLFVARIRYILRLQFRIGSEAYPPVPLSFRYIRQRKDRPGGRGLTNKDAK